MESISMRRTAIKATMRIVAREATKRQRPAKATPANSREWTREEIMLLRRRYQFVTAAELARRMGRSLPSVRAKIRSLGLTKSRLGASSDSPGPSKTRRPRKRTARPGWKTDRNKRPSTKRSATRSKVVRKAAPHHPRPVPARRWG